MKTTLLHSMIGLGLTLSFGFGLVVQSPAMLVQADDLSAQDDGEKVVITYKGNLVAQYIYTGVRKPIVYPIIGPFGVRMTRDYPMKIGTPFEAKDHPHQQSLWFTHGDVNGISFWHIEQGSGTIVAENDLRLACSTHEADGQSFARAAVTQSHRWLGPNGDLICRDEQRVTFQILPEGELTIDMEITLKATEGDLRFGDTKEGTMGIRSHPALRLEGEAATGQAINSEGVTGKAIWGKRAAWVDYWGTVDGKEVGFAIFDHPGNLRHPTWWHAREYGLVAANPFGISNFENKPQGSGDFELKKDESISLRYRFLFHVGDSQTGQVADRYGEFAEQ
ncbi:MAG TPA: hypothetical protein DEW46_08375 [Verrucomicrobia bacterium]|nr:hypothetical protein [Verrucomicrobiota bacterium]